MASLFIYLASRGGGPSSTFLNYLVPNFLINALGSHPAENNFLCEIISRCSTNNFIDTWPWRMPWYGVSEITQLFSAQLGAHSPALLASWGNFFALNFFSSPSLRPNLGCCVSGREESLVGANTSQLRWLMLQLIVLPSLVPIQNFVQPIIKIQLLQSSHRKSW